MLNWLTSRIGSSNTSASEHPLASDKGIAAYLAELPTANPQSTLRELIDWFSDPPSFMEHMSPSRAAEAVEQLDEFAQKAVARCWSDLLVESRSQRQGSLATGGLKAYLAASHDCNRRILESLAADPTGSQDKYLLARFALRATHNWIQLKKLGRLTYQAADPAWWKTAHGLLRQARELGILYLALPIYSGQHLPSSIWKEYQVGLLLETAPLTNLTANEIDATDRLVRWIEPHCRFVESRSEQTSFCIVPEGDNAPARCQENKEYSEATRFFGIGLEGQQQLAQLREALGKEEKLPEWLVSTGCDRDRILRLLQQLAVHWSPSPPSRRHPRHQTKGTIRVVNGLDMVRRMLAASEFAKSGRDLDYDNYLKNFNARHREHAVVTEAAPPPPKTPMDVLRLLETAGDQQMMETWEILDVSRGGLGVRFTARRPWQGIGALVGYRQDDELDWHVGIIRRLGSSHGKPNAGLSTFLGNPVCSQVRMAAVTQASDTWSHISQETSALGWYNAILVSAEAKVLLVPTDVLSMDRPIQVSIAGHWRLARLIKLQRQGSDYDLAVYQEIATTP